MTSTSSASARFAALVERCGGQLRTSVALGIDRSYVSMLVRGARRPSLRVATAIEVLSTSSGDPIPASSWAAPVRRPRAAA